MRVPDTGTGTRAGYHATDAHGFPCTSLSLYSSDEVITQAKAVLHNVSLNKYLKQAY